MEIILIGYKRKSNNNEDTDAGTSEGSGDTSSREQGGWTRKTRKYDSSHLSLNWINFVLTNKPIHRIKNGIL